MTSTTDLMKDVQKGQHWRLEADGPKMGDDDDGSYDYVVVDAASHLPNCWIMEGTGGERIYMTPMQMALGWWRRVV